MDTVTKILKPFSSRKSTDRPSVDQFSKNRNLGSNAKNLNSKRNFVTFSSVQVQRYKNPKNVIIGHLNVNPLTNKFVTVDELTIKKIDICLISQTKVDTSFLNQQFKINGYKMFRRDRDRFGEGLMFYVNEQIPSQVLSLESIPMDTELILLEFTIENRRWLCIGTYRPPFQNEKYFIDHISKTLS